MNFQILDKEKKKSRSKPSKDEKISLDYRGDLISSLATSCSLDCQKILINIHYSVKDYTRQTEHKYIHVF